MDYKTLILGTQGLTNYYRLDEVRGNKATDPVGARTGTYTGGFTLNTSGALLGDTDSAVLFNGTTGYVDLGTGGVGSGNNVSMEAWFKTLGGSTTRITEAGTSASAAAGIMLIFGNTGLVQFFVGNQTTQSSATSSGIFNDGNWHHAVGTYDGATINIYVDGTLQGTLSVVVAVSVGATPKTFIGVNRSASSGFFNGSIDEVAYYNQALSLPVVQSHYWAGRTYNYGTLR